MRAIGAGVNEWQVCETLLGLGDFDCFLLAGRYTLLEQEALDSFLPLCEGRDVGIILGGPFNSGILATGPVAGARYNYAPAPPDILARVSRIEAVCLAHGVKLIEAALQFVLGHPGGQDGHSRRQQPGAGEGEPRAAECAHPAGALVGPESRGAAARRRAGPDGLGDFHAPRTRPAADA